MEKGDLYYIVDMNPCRPILETVKVIAFNKKNVTIKSTPPVLKKMGHIGSVSVIKRDVFDSLVFKTPSLAIKNALKNEKNTEMGIYLLTQLCDYLVVKLNENEVKQNRFEYKLLKLEDFLNSFIERLGHKINKLVRSKNY